MKLIRLIIIFSIYLISGSSLFAQSGANVRGFVYTKDDGEPVLFTNVYMKGTTIGASTDINGFFSITKIPAGTYTLTISFLGYDTLQEVVTVKAGDITNKKFYLTKGAVQLEEYTVSADQQTKIEDTKVSVNKIDPIIINKLPSIGEPDLAQYMQVLPGVVFTGDQGGQLYIRGGTPVQNKVLLDGMIVYNPFHSIGLFSVFDNDIIRNADVYTGGFGAEYGGRISSIMDITTRDGNKKRMEGKISASTFGAKLLIEGPLLKLKENGKGSISYLFSGKQSYLPQTSKVLYRYADTSGLPFGFTDLYGKISFNASNGSKLNVFGYNFSDFVKYVDIANFKWNSFGGGTNFIIIPPSSNTLVEGNFAYSQYKISAQSSSDTIPKTSDINGFNLGLKFTNFIGKDEVKYGFEMIGFKTGFKFFNEFGSKIEQEENTTEIGGFLKYKHLSKNKKFVIEPSFRLHYYASLSNISPEPRFSMKYNMKKTIRFKMAGGVYSQNLIAANSDRDIVNLFYGFLSGPENLQETYTPKPGAEEKELNTKLQKSVHAVGGVEFDLFKYFEINIEAYKKWFTHLTNINRDKIYEDDPAHTSFPDAQKKDFIVETGWAKGLDFVLKYDRKRFYIWTTYSLGFNKRWDGIREYNPIWDRRHNVNVVTSYTFGKKKRWEANARWNYGSGFPFTPTAGYYPKLNLNGDIDQDYTTSNGSVGYIPGELNSKRLPQYHRLDLGVKFKYAWTDKILMEINLGVSNAYDRANIFYFDRITQKRKNQLPFLPNLNFNLTF
ncbi:MAG: TonB-dependent receptor [Bacteroidota bacterium]|nr:TonB-dependent receptor [Bacteroidota bacterium]